MNTNNIDKAALVERLKKKAKAFTALGFDATSLLLTKASDVIQDGISDNKFTAIYTDSWMVGSHRQTLTLMKRIEKQENETLEQMLEREDVSEGLTFLFHGHSQMQGE